MSRNESEQQQEGNFNSKTNKMNVAKLRWKMLSRVITQKSSAENDVSQELNAISVRRFSNFGLFDVTPASETKKARVEATKGSSCFIQCTYECKDFPIATVMIRQLVKDVYLNDLLGFNNTGNICIWPSEEVLAYYCIKHKDKFRSSKICELGAGMSALAGVMIAAASEADEVLLTDGNQQSVDNIQFIIEKNKERFGSTHVSARTLVWDIQLDLSEYKSYFDYIICADCLFFEDCHQGILHVIKIILKTQGVVIIFAPSRGKSLTKFAELAEKDFDVEYVKNYDEKVWNKHLEETTTKDSYYDENLHFPIMLVLKPK